MTRDRDQSIPGSSLPGDAVKESEVEEKEPEESVARTGRRLWVTPCSYLCADFFMRLSVLLTTFQISWWEVASSSGYDGIIVFFRMTPFAMAASVTAIVIACIADPKMGIFVTALISCVLVFVSALLGILTGIAEPFKRSEYVFLTMEMLNYTLIIFEPARMVIVLIHTLDDVYERTKIVCASMVWLRELAVIIAYLLVEYLRNVDYYQYIVNSIAIVGVIVYVVIICTVERVRFGEREKIMFLRITQCYFTYLPSVNRVKPKYFEPDNKFTVNEKYCTIQFLRIYRALSAFIIFYFAQQLLYIVWDFNGKLLILGMNLKGSIQVKLAVFNLINLPLIFGLLFPLMGRAKILKFQINLKLLGVGYLALFLSLLITMLAQFIQNADTEGLKPGSQESMVRIYNMIDSAISINSTWTGDQHLEANSLFVSKRFEAKGLVSSQLIIDGPQPMNKFSKSIFSKEFNSATFVIVSDKMRRVTGYDEIHEGVLDSRGPLAIVSTYSTLLKQFNMEFVNKDTSEEKFIDFPEVIYMKNTHIFKPGDYKILMVPEEDVTFQMGGVYTIMVYSNGSSTSPIDARYMIHQQFKAATLPLWSLLALYFLSFASVIEVVLISFFIITEAPQIVRTLLFAFYFFNKTIGSGSLYLIVYILSLKNLTMALFVTFCIYTANACFYWAVMIKFKSLRNAES